MTLIMARNTFPRWEGCGSGQAGWEPAPKDRPTGWGRDWGAWGSGGGGTWGRGVEKPAGGVGGEEGSWGQAARASKF